jgi:hypothetical protein
MKLKASALLIATSLLSGCASTVYKTQLEVYCPPLKEYSVEFGLDLADELERLPDNTSKIVSVISDYIALRDLIRACEANSKKLER